jgi:hypothetical protein
LFLTLHEALGQSKRQWQWAVGSRKQQAVGERLNASVFSLHTLPFAYRLLPLCGDKLKLVEQHCPLLTAH